MADHTHITAEVRDVYTRMVDSGRFTWESLREYATAQEAEARSARGKTMGTHETGGWEPVIALCDEQDKAGRGDPASAPEKTITDGTTKRKDG